MALHSNAVSEMNTDPEKRKGPSHIKTVVPWGEVKTQYYLFFLREEEDGGDEEKNDESDS